MAPSFSRTFRIPPMSAPRPAVHELHPAEVDDQAGLLAELGEGLTEGRDRYASSSP